MFTVKVMFQNQAPDLCQNQSNSLGSEPTSSFTSSCTSTKLIEATEVNIERFRDGDLVCLTGTTSNGQCFCEYVANPCLPKPEGFAEEGTPGEIKFGRAAYIENSSGATTEVIKF